MDVSKIIVLDVFWDEIGNGGRVEDIVRGWHDPRKYRWLDPFNNCVYLKTVKDEFWLFEHSRVNPLNAYSGCGHYLEEDYFERIDSRYETVFNQLYNSDKSTTVFLSVCKGCGCIIATTLNTYARKDEFYCNSCSKRLEAVKQYGSLADARPDCGSILF